MKKTLVGVLAWGAFKSYIGPERNTDLIKWYEKLKKIKKQNYVLDSYSYGNV